MYNVRRMPSKILAAERTRRPSAFWPTVWLVVALITIKGSYVAFSSFWDWATPKDYFSWLFVRWTAGAAYDDVLFAVGVGAAAAVLLFAVRRNERSTRIVFWTLLVFGAFAVLYAVIGRQVFSYYAAPLTYQLLSMSGETTKMWSSLEPFVTAFFIIGLIGVPVAYALLVLASRKVEGVLRPPAVRVIRVVCLLALIAWLGLGWNFAKTEGKWFTAQDRYLPESPHTTLLLSVLAAVPGARSSLSGVHVTAEDVRDFSTPPAPPAGAMASSTGVTPRNVVIIVLESVGTQYLSLYGNKLNTAPRLTAEQTSAIVFDKYYAPVAWTAYSLLALASSRMPPTERYNTTSFRTTQEEGEGLANVLRKAGYRTAFMASGDPDWASGGFLERTGFQEVVHGSELEGAAKVSSWGTEDRFLFRSMLNWIKKGRGEPFFLMAWTDQTHHPYEVAPGQKLVDVLPGDDEESEELSRYLSLVNEADAQIGALLDSLRRSGLADSTLVIVTGDHGEAFGTLHGGGGHGFTVYDEEVRVPLMIWNPALFKGGTRSAVVGSHPDLAPTVLDILGIPAPSGWDGRSMFDSTRSPRAYFFAAAWGEYLLGVREQDVKYVYDARQGREELFDLSTDPDEQKNLASVDTALARRLRGRLAGWLQVETRRRASR